MSHVAKVEKPTVEQSEVVANILVEVKALYYQLPKFRRQSNLSIPCSQRLRNKKIIALKALKKLEGEKSASKQFRTIANLLTKIRALHSQFSEAENEWKMAVVAGEKFVSEPSRTITELTVKVKELCFKFLEVEKFHHREVDLRLNALYRMKLYEEKLFQKALDEAKVKLDLV
ncbi:hypothetical protein NE237_021208 [Protea cynaroides]|uniref:Uncharacterized protein n=1 Tax=Protea cynaroides TaxID=273540 RepID=A0A9Q0HAQ3_9MAGN|nr:hypothetical protein NE237_021208 [Protea cynaroides]